MEVVTDANMTFEVVGLKTNSAVHIAITGAIKDVGRTIVAPTNLGTTSKGTCASLIDCWATSNVDVLKLCGNYGITIAG